MMHVVSNSRVCSSTIEIFAESEHAIGNDGIYVGKTAIYKLPFFLNPEGLLNPHLATLGMTGSGKTYFLKSNLIRQRMHDQSTKVIIVDWNGEYRDVVNYLSGRIIEIRTGEERIDSIFDGAVSVDLSGMVNDAKRKEFASKVVETIIERMHGMRIGAKRRVIILLDEVWRLLGNNRSLGQLFREGRKYGFAVFIATQMASDINNEILSNAGALFIFRLQNNADYDTLIKAGLLDGAHRERLSSLPIGSCAVRLAHKGGNTTTNFFIKSVDGFQTNDFVLKGGRMQTKISGEKFARITAEQISNNETRVKLLNFLEANSRSVDLVGVVRILQRGGVARAEIISYLMSIGVGDLEAVEAYESVKGVEIA